jgi:hypothetical protein
MLSLFVFIFLTKIKNQPNKISPKNQDNKRKTQPKQLNLHIEVDFLNFNQIEFYKFILSVQNANKDNLLRIVLIG